MIDSKKETYSVPRFLSFIDLAYLQEAMKVVDQHFQSEIHGTDERDKIGNLNATCQSLFRAAFISAFATLEQNLDELVRMDQKKKDIRLSPADLKHRGIKRSTVYANKVLKMEIETTGLSRDTPQNKDLVGFPVFIGLRAGRLGSPGSNCPALSR
ncbi:MAG: hypothetical protein R6V15_07510 [Desulfotignum sp.]